MSSIAHRRSRHARAARRAFTLVEVAIVVVIVGVLAVLGIAGYRRYTATARMAEATNVIGGIRAAQEAFKTEKGVYAGISNDTSSFYPAASPGNFVTEWGADCKTCKATDGWRQLTVHPSQPVMFGYATVAEIVANFAASAAPAPKAMAAPAAAPAAAKATDPFYIAIAWGDTNGDGTPCIVTGYSFSNQLLIESAGE